MGPGLDRTCDPGSAVRHASVARHVTDCATRPGKLSGVVFIMLINVKMPTIVVIFNIYEQDKFRDQLS